MGIAPKHVFWQFCEFFFIGVYTFELVIKIWITGCRYVFCGQDALWNWYDLIILLISYIDVTITYIIYAGSNSEQADLETFMILKVLRLTRLGRLVRAFRFKIFSE